MKETFNFKKEQNDEVNRLLDERSKHLTRIKELEEELSQIYMEKSDSENKTEQHYVTTIMQHPVNNQIEALIVKEKEEIVKIEEKLSSELN